MPSEMCILIFVTTILIKRETHPASYILMESMLCLFKPVTSFSSELAQLPKKEKKTKGKKRKKKEQQMATQLLNLKIFLALPGCPHYRHRRDFSPNLVLQI